MNVLNLKFFNTPAPSGLMDVVRGWIASKDVEADLDLPARAPAAPKSDTIDKARYERILDHELDRQLMTEVEREDAEMLARVRDALYADD